MEDLSHERTFYTMLFSPGLKTPGYEPDEKFEFDVTTPQGDRHIEDRKTLTAVGVVLYLLVAILPTTDIEYRFKLPSTGAASCDW